MTEDQKMDLIKSVCKNGVNFETFIMDNHGILNVSNQKKDGGKPGKLSDEQIAKVLSNCVGENKVINTKWKWAGAYWFLRWKYNYPVDTKDFCEKVNNLPLKLPLKYKCDYRNIREITTSSFMDKNPNDMDQIKISKNEEKLFTICREIVLKLEEKFGK